MYDLTGELEERYHQYDVLQLISVIEESFVEKIFYETDPSLAFPPGDISAVKFNGERQVTLTLSVMGLLGVTTPLPITFSDYVNRGKKGAGPLQQFLSIMQNRLHALWIGAQRKYAIWHGAGDIARRLFETMTARDIDTFAAPDLFWLPLFARRTRTSAGLKMIIRSIWRDIPVYIKENIIRQTTIANRRPVGSRFQLGVNAVAGSKVRDRTAAFRVTLGPVDIETYKKFLPGEANYNTLKNTIARYVNEPLICELEILCRRRQSEPARLGGTAQDGPGGIGRTLPLSNRGGGMIRYRTKM